MPHGSAHLCGNSLVLGVDLGATNAKVGLVTADGRVVRRTSVASEPEQGPDATVERIGHAAVRLVEEAGAGEVEVAGVGVAAAGTVDAERGVLLYWPNVPSWRNVPLQGLFEERLGLPCALENDGNAAALAEHWIGVGRGCSSLVLLTLGTGIGGGVVLEGRLWRGANGAAGELGHMCIDPDGPACSCGGRGCLQAYAGARGIVRRMQAALDAGEASILSGGRAELTPERIHRAALEGDEAARRYIADTGRYLGVGVSNLLHLLNPDVVALSGGITAAGEMLLAPLRAEVEARTLEASRRRVQLAFSAVPGDAGIIGAARRFLLDLPDRQPSP
jgi:glucokinase